MDTSKKILVVDDFATMRKMLISMLQKLGFSDITETDSAVKAWEILQTTRFDLVISDFNMPDMDGIELLEAVKANSAMAATHFILLTAEDDVSLVLESKAAKVDAYILKPFKIEVIAEKLKSIFS